MRTNSTNLQFHVKDEMQVRILLTPLSTNSIPYFCKINVLSFQKFGVRRTEGFSSVWSRFNSYSFYLYANSNLSLYIGYKPPTQKRCVQFFSAVAQLAERVVGSTVLWTNSNPYTFFRRTRSLVRIQPALLRSHPAIIGNSKEEQGRNLYVTCYGEVAQQAEQVSLNNFSIGV